MVLFKKAIKRNLSSSSLLVVMGKSISFFGSQFLHLKNIIIHTEWLRGLN